MSKQAISLLDLTLTASGAVSEYRAVKVSGAQASVAGEQVIGVAVYSAANGEAYAATAKGTAVAETGGAITLGAELAVDASGRAVAASALAVAAGATPMTSSAANGAVLSGGVLPQHVFATALQAADGAGEFIEVLLK